ncbi:flavin reductase [Roseobacter sp. HKCCD9010]|uniref:flavin reductase family protein n=1 Tax=unclassified Roseobacter TaxID=196798 RepID=UPI001492DA5C|nr:MULTISPECIES: flavin reductase family protein [unclassified Roseobacter]MBF9050319.1 flavin reductase [Rhodobacterales bacterium HKCCD4356]NNV12562.1 flavin reductase [Roseobacter sp. HKCCD7357]NNV15973.1 flavin reductase [Roseobacter sp. HKCCD8768]NNV25433.1 flavin reductase [Roseobacter sp. HKCCD8192]NNV29690.1 flavin reductase [Roseobacter sp. HKCCD9061]
MSDTPTLRDDFIEGMSRAAASVSVVTTDGPAGRAGVTVSAMTSISADGERPTMLACVNASSSALPLILENGCFCINVLRIDQNDVSDVFSSRLPAPGGDKFNCTKIEAMPSGAPRLVEALVSFDCVLVSAEKHGTHHICIGAVDKVVTAPEGSPLLYGMRRYLRAEKH